MKIVSTVAHGTAFARFCKALAVAKGDVLGAASYAASQAWGSTPQVELALKALVNPLDTDDIVAATGPIAYDLAELLRPLTVLGRMTSARRAPFRTRVLVQAVGGSGAWVGQNKPIPVSAMGINDDATLDPLKVGAIRVLTSELMRTALSGSEDLIKADCAASQVEATDNALLNPANSGDDETPASIAFGAPSFSSSGSGLADIDADLALMVKSLVDAEMPLATAMWVMSPVTATNLALKRGASGAPAYPLISAKGGSLLGLPVTTSTSCAASGSPGERFMLLVEQSEILVADDGGGSIELATSAALQMDDAPVDGARPMVSLWQNNLVGLKMIRYANWRRRRAGAVAVLRDLVY